MKTFAAPLLALTLCASATADIVPTPGTLPVKPIFEKSDLVCKCFVRSLDVLTKDALGTGPKALIRRRTQATVDIQDSYKSNLQERGPAFVEFVEIVPQVSGFAISSSLPGLWQGETALLFLTRSQAGRYEFADPFLGVTPFHSFPQVDGEAGLAKLQHALVVASGSANRDDRIRALQLLQGFDSFNPETLSVVDNVSRSQDPEIAIPALGVLLKTKSPESVEKLKSYLDSYRSDADLLAFSSVGSELGQIGNIKALSAPEALTNSHFIAIRHGAMDAIRRIRSVKSVPLLISKLDDPDSAIQYIAVITLAEIHGKYNGDYAPSMYLFDEKPQYYTVLWKSWWVEHGGKP